MEQVETLIVGAGLAGLSCAAELARRGRAALLIEAGDHPGGRCLTHQDNPHQPPLDWGAEWVIPDMQPAVMGLIRRFNLTLLSEEGETRWQVPGFDAVASYDDLCGLRPGVRAGLDALEAWAGRETDGPDQALIQLVDSLVPDPFDRALILAAIFPLTGADPSLVSAQGFRSEIAVHGGAIDQTLNADTLRIAQGTGAIAQALAATLPDPPRYGWHLTGITLTDAGGIAHFAQGPIAARTIVLALPVATLGGIDLPYGLGQGAAANAGQVIKFWAEVSAPVPGLLSSTGPLRLLYRYDHAGRHYVSAQGLAAQVRGHAPAALITAACPGARVIWAKSHDWPAEPRAQGSWMTPAKGHDPASFYANPFGPIRVIGGDVAPAWVGWMEGAILSGTATARAL